MSQTLIVRTRCLDHERGQSFEAHRKTRKGPLEDNGWQEWLDAQDARIRAHRARILSELVRRGEPLGNEAALKVCFVCHREIAGTDRDCKRDGWTKTAAGWICFRHQLGLLLAAQCA